MCESRREKEKEEENDTWGSTVAVLQFVIQQETIGMLSVWSNRLTQEPVWDGRHLEVVVLHKTDLLFQF